MHFLGESLAVFVYFIICYPERQRSHFDDFACGSLSVFLHLKYPINYTSSGYVHSRPCQEPQPKSLQHNTLNKSRHRKETAQSLFMAELQRLSSKQQILLNLYQVSDEQKEWANRHKHRLCERVAAETLHERIKESNQVFSASITIKKAVIHSG